MRALLSIVAIAALAAAAPGRPVTACDTLKTACSDLYRSIECGTLENCIPYWERLKTPVGNDTELCATCKEMVQEARENLLSNLTQSELQEVLEGSCDVLIPIPPFNGICKKLMDTFQDELNDMLVSRMDPTQVCTVSGLCWKPDNSDIEQRASEIFLRQSAKKTCNTCKASVTNMAAITKFAGKRDFIEGFSNACQGAGYSKAKCDEFAQTYFAKFLHHFQLAPSERTCQFLGRCDGPSRPMSVGPADTMECEFCEAMIHKVVVQFNNTSMKQQVKTVLENICKTTGSWAAECQQRIEDDFDKAYDELISMLNPVKACTLAGICNSKQSLRSLPMAKLTPARPATALGSAAMCTICQDVAKVVQKAVNANFTQNQLIGALDLVCDVLPTASKENCFDFVNKNVPQLIQMFNERFTVDHICSESFKFCPAATELRAEFREDKCHMCETAVSWVASELNSTRTEDDIIKLVQEVCDTDLIPPKSKSSCRSEIEAYGSLIIHLLVHRMDPGQICSEIRLCNAPRAVKPAAQVPDPVCDECQLIANHIVAALDDDRTERNIKNVLDKTCQMIPVDYGRCEQFINTNLDQLFEILRQKVTADEICKTLRLCASRVAVADAECVLCSQVVDYLIHKLKGNFSDAAALEAMEKVCKVLPVDQKQCQNYIDVYGGYILSMLERGFAADAVCAAIGLCDKPKPVDRAPEGVTCEECQKIAGYIVEAINDDRSEANIKAVLERTCEACPDVDGCRKFIDENVDTLFELLRQEVTVDRICKTVGLCGARNLPRPAVMKSGSTGCELCSDVVGYLIGELKDNTTDAAILDALQRVCEILPVDRAECQNVINVYGEYIISMIQQDATPNAICAAIGRCKLLKPIARAPADICEECQKIAGYIVMAINDDRSEANIKAVLDKTCESCPDMDGCRKFMDEHVDALFELLRQEVTVDRICKTLGLCAAPEPAARAPRHTCEECQKFAGYIVAAINDDHSEANIKAVLENTCEACPDKDGCRKFMDEHVDALFELLRQEVTVDGICKALKLCEAPKPAARAPGHTCEECQKVAGYIVAAINDDRSEANIKAVLENTCEACPDKDGCRKFMDEHVDALFELLRQEVTVDGICKALKLCGAQKPVVRAPGVVCEECQKIAGYIVAAVNDDRSQENIKAVLEKTCELCPDIDGCQQFIDTNLDQLFELLRTEVTVDHICKSLRLCGVRISTASATKSGTDRAPASDSCQLCQSIAGFVITELKANKTQSAIVAALERGCAVLPVDQTQCKNIIDTYSSMIVSMIQNDLTPDEICGTLKFCSAPRPKGQSCELCETVAHFLVDELKDNKTAAAILDALERVCNVLPVDKVSCRNTIDTYGSIIMSLIQQDASADEICAAIGLCSTGKIARISGADSCNACKAITGFLIDELKDNQTDAAVIAALEKVCKVVPIDKTQCQNYIDVYGNMVIELIKNNLSADEICSTIGFCSTGEIQSSDSQVCPLCEIVVHLVEAELENRNTQSEIEAALDKACSLMPESEQQECRNMVIVYTASIIDMLESLASAEQICQTFRFCPTPPTPPKCEVCLYITNFVESELSDNRTEAQILKLLDKACDVIPSVDVPQCKETINQFSDMIITLLLQSIPPRKICEEIKMCQVSKKPSAFSRAQARIADGEQCALCKWLVIWVDDKLQDNRTEAIIIDEIGKACDLLSDAKRCKDMVNDYVDMIVKMLVQYADPEKICEAVRKCPAKQLKKDDPPCRYCRYVVDELRSDVQKTEADLKKELDGICRVLPVDPSSCQTFVEQYADQIINLILSDADPEKICEMLGVCLRRIKATTRKCNFCEEVMRFVTNEVQDETNDDEIVALVARACDFVPAIHREDCRRMVEIEGLLIVRLIGQSLDADSICEAVNYCPEKRNSYKLACTWCQYALHFIQEKLYDNSTQEAIKQELEKMCSDLPKPDISAECKEFVDTYGTSLEVIIAQDLDPSVICPAIHACPAPRVPIKHARRTSSQKCHDCVSTLRSFRHNPAQICTGVSPQFADRCVGASSTGLQIVNVFGNDFGICKLAKSCFKLSGSFTCNRGGCQHAL